MILPQPGNLWHSTLLHIYSRPLCPANLIMGNDQLCKEGKGRFGKRGRNKVRVRLPESFFMIVTGVNFFFSVMLPSVATGGDKLVALYSSHAVPYSTPWVAEELGLFNKYDLDFDFVYIPSSSTATAAILGGNVEVGLLGGVGVVNAFVSG